MVGKAQKSLGARSGLYGESSNGVPPISVGASTATFQSCNADAPLRLIRHPKNGSFKATVTPFSRSGLSVVRSSSFAKRGTWKKRPSLHLYKVPTRSNNVSPRTLQTALVSTIIGSFQCCVNSSLFQTHYQVFRQKFLYEFHDVLYENIQL
jgi:hypothetical protein